MVRHYQIAVIDESTPTQRIMSTYQADDSDELYEKIDALLTLGEASPPRVIEISEASTEDESDNLPEVGDTVVDGNPPSWSDENELEVVEVLDYVRADEYVIEGKNEGQALEQWNQAWNDRTVADANPSYPEDDVVVRAKYVDGSKVYAYPASRLAV